MVAMRWLLVLVVGLGLAGSPMRVAGQEPMGGPPATTSADVKIQPKGDAYTLPPETLAKAVAYSRARTTLGFVDTGWGILQLLLLLTLGVVYRMRNVAVNVTRGMGRGGKAAWAQGAIFLFELMVVTTLLKSACRNDRSSPGGGLWAVGAGLGELVWGSGEGFWACRGCLGCRW